MLTPQEQNILVAESVGFTKHISKYDCFGEQGEVDTWKLFNNKGECIVNGLPNYHSDLNACAELEKTLTTKEQRDSYVRYLYCIKNKAMPFEATVLWAQFDLVSVIAPQRLEAYLRVKGLWKD